MIIHGTQKGPDGQPYHANVVPSEDGASLATHDAGLAERLDETNRKLALVAKLLLALAGSLNANIEQGDLAYTLAADEAAILN